MSELEELGVTAVDQNLLEQEITRKASAALLAKDAELETKRLEKAIVGHRKIVDRLKVLTKQLNHPRTKISQKKILEDQIKWIEVNELAPAAKDVADIESRLKENESMRAKSDGNVDHVETSKISNERLPDESERDFLVRTGKITAFGNQNIFTGGTDEAHLHRQLREPGFQPSFKNGSDSEINNNGGEMKANEDGLNHVNTTIKAESPQDVDLDDTKDESDYHQSDGESDYQSDEADSDNIVEDLDDLEEDGSVIVNDQDIESTQSSSRNVDDGDENEYQKRLAIWVSERQRSRGKGSETNSEQPEYQRPHPNIEDAVLNDQFRLPGDIFPLLFDYQKTCVQWLWELYQQKTGGIIGDEMGLGKTVQVIAFIAGLHYSGLLDKPVLVVVPATVLNQWVNEFHRWWPPLRCIILHSIGSGMKSGSRSTTNNLDDEFEDLLEEGNHSTSKDKMSNAKKLVDRIVLNGHVLVTTYVGLRIYQRIILPHQWGYCVLDEGHKIRNPDLEISLTCKRVKTPNRIILLGTPIQNNLTELWLLFDFVFPGRLGTLPVFQQQFSVPINMGGYANALNVQVQTGYKCAVVLRDLISPYLLRRLKSDVAQDLPKKLEMVLFVKLTPQQQEMYEKFLLSEDLSAILKGKRNMLMGVDILRKICNHPDLVNRDMLMHKQGYNYGDYNKLGKMIVLKNLLQLWQSQGHRTLLFCQTRQMLDILEQFVRLLKTLDESRRFNYLRMDGLTAISNRQDLIDTFNTDINFDLFLLTTKVGGLGVNLTGADRVIIYDPDWNPLTDIQARERAWRLGQKKDITIYRLMTAGLIEEKIYHRQIFKTFLTNKILKDPKQRRFFKMNDLQDLFSLGSQEEQGTETGDMFEGSEKQYMGTEKRKLTKFFKQHKNDDDFYQVAGINGVSKLDEFMTSDHEGEDEEEGTKDNKIMENIFANSGVHSTLQHDEIVNLDRQEFSLVEREASKVAASAAAALKESRKLARKNKVGVPTWTGKFGRVSGTSQAGGIRKPIVSAQGPIGRGSKLLGLSSSNILSDLRKKSEKFSFSTNQSTQTDPKHTVLHTIISFLNTQEGHFSNSAKILKELKKSETNTQRNIIMIRAMLKEAAIWDEKRKGWVLKEDLRRLVA